MGCLAGPPGGFADRRSRQAPHPRSAFRRGLWRLAGSCRCRWGPVLRGDCLRRSRRPASRGEGWGGRRWLVVVGFGVVLAVMNYSIYQAFARIPLGIAVTVEFLGPLALAVASSRRAIDLLWGALAGGGGV